jgi:hypothetical protein
MISQETRGSQDGLQQVAGDVGTKVTRCGFTTTAVTFSAAVNSRLVVDTLLV